MEWLKVNAPIGSLTEDNLEHCAVALYEELARRHTMVGEANSSQHSFQLAASSREIFLGGERGWRGEGRGVGQFANRTLMSQADKWCYDSK